MRFPVVRRGILWVTHRGNPDVFIHTFPPVLNLHTSQTGNPLHRLGNKSETGKLVRKVGVKPQTSTRSWPKGLRSINDNYCVSNVVGLKDSVIVSNKMESLNPPPVTDQKNSKLTLNVDSHVANAHIVTGLPQRKDVNPNICQLYTKIKYVKDVSCVGHLPSVKLVTNAQHAVLDPPVGARLNQCWKKWETLGSSPKVVTILREGYTLPFRFRPHLTRSPTNKQLPQSYQTVLPFRGTVSADKQKCSRTGGQSKFIGVLQPAIFGTQTQQPVETHPRPEHLEHLFKHRVVQDGDPRDHKNLPPGRGVGHIHRFQRCILPYTHSQSVQEVHAFSPPGSVLSVQSPSLWPFHSSHGVHSGGQRGQTPGPSQGYKDPPVPRRLAGESLYPPYLSPAYSNPSHILSGIRVAGEPRKVRTGSQTALQLRRLPVRPERGQGQTNRRTLAGLDRQDQINDVGSGMSGPEIHVPHRSPHSNRKTSPLRATPHETHTVALEKQLEGPRVTGKGDPGPQVPPPPSKVVAGGKQCATRSTITPFKTCSADLYRRIKRRVGRSLGRPHCKGNLGPSREQVTHKPLRAKSSFSSSKGVSNPGLQQDSVDSYRQHNSGCLYQQRRGDEVGVTVCPTVENPVLVHQTAGNPQGTSHPRLAECDSRQAIQTWPDHSNRVVTSSSSVPSCSRSVYEAKWTIFTKWCLSNQVDFRAPPLKAIADFLLHLFQEKKLQPGTIDGYRSAIADKLGNSTINVSKDENLTCLLDSFHRDRPKGRRGIPSWNLSLVLHQLTKAPFEPLKESSLKHLTFKTVFLLALGSGKRRSEIHAWLHKNIRHQSDWSKVSLYPSPSFLSKNQLAKEGPDSVAPVVIPALAPSLDRSLKGDRSLCPVRALRYYLDRTANLRQNKELVFVSFKKGFDKDISLATISSWIKQTVVLCYELSDQEALALHQVKAHDVRAFAASKAFQSGISLDL